MSFMGCWKGFQLVILGYPQARWVRWKWWKLRMDDWGPMTQAAIPPVEWKLLWFDTNCFGQKTWNCETKEDDTKKSRLRNVYHVSTLLLSKNWNLVIQRIFTRVTRGPNCPVPHSPWVFSPTSPNFFQLWWHFPAFFHGPQNADVPKNDVPGRSACGPCRATARAVARPRKHPLPITWGIRCWNNSVSTMKAMKIPMEKSMDFVEWDWTWGINLRYYVLTIKREVNVRLMWWFESGLNHHMEMEPF